MKYRVVLEFDHPGSGVPSVDNEDVYLDPSNWRWDCILGPECTSIDVEVFALNFTTLKQDYYVRGRKDEM